MRCIITYQFITRYTTRQITSMPTSDQVLRGPVFSDELPGQGELSFGNNIALIALFSIVMCSSNK